MPAGCQLVGASLKLPKNQDTLQLLKGGSGGGGGRRAGRRVDKVTREFWFIAFSGDALAACAPYIEV